MPPYRDGEDSLYFETFNRGKRSVSLDLRSPAGRAVFEDLVRVSDAVYSNLRGDQPARLRITFEDLRALNPRIVCCSLSGFGNTGPRRAEPAYDYVLQALTGWMALTGEPDGPPVKSGLSLVDFSGGYVSALALVAGVWRARRDGVGCDCDTSLFETALVAADLRRDVGRVARARHRAPRRVRAPVDRALPGVPDRGRLDHGRGGQAEVLARAVRGAGAGARRPTRGSRASTSAPSTARSCSRSCARGCRR